MVRVPLAVCAALAALPVAAVALQKSPAPRKATGPTPASAQQGAPAVAAGHPVVEMVFVLDTTGSMAGLIEGAKSRIWAIVNDVMRAPSKPRVRIGLVAYRDQGDAYVTKMQPLTSDLDKVYATLMDYKAEGGGDTPEDVEAALAEGVRQVGWAPRDRQTAQILFLVGDAPPHPEYQIHPSVEQSAADAIARGIVVNAVQCGNLPGTQEVWRQIARSGEGEFFAIPQDGGVQVVATPYDRKLAELGGKMGQTFVAYGGGRGASAARASVMTRQAAAESRFSAGAAPSALADRAVNKAINAEAYDRSDLLQQIEDGKVKADRLKDDDLPEDLKKLSAAARQKEVERRLSERRKLKTDILALSKQRDAFLAEQRRKQTRSAGAKGFDAAVAAALKKQIARRGIRL